MFEVPVLANCVSTELLRPWVAPSSATIVAGPITIPIIVRAVLSFLSVIAAPLTDAGLTTYSAIKPALPMLVPGTTAVVVGIGGLGLLAVQFLRSLCSARVIAVDSNQARLEFAKAHGADVTILSDASAAEHIRDFTSGRGATFVLEGVGVDATLEMGIAVVEDQIVDQWDLTRHNTSVVCTVDRSECDPIRDPEYQDRAQQKRDFRSDKRYA